jgi:hypothetical protein
MKAERLQFVIKQVFSTRIIVSLACVGTVALSVACAPRHAQFESLMNKGVVPVSPENPFNGSNLFLAKEMEQSVYLYNFLKEKGSPQAIELKGSNPENPEAHLFYADSNEEYIAQPAPRRSRAKDAPREWIIIGPFEIDRHHYSDVQQLKQNPYGVFEIFGRREVLGKEPPRGESSTLQPVFIPTPKPRPVVHKKTHKAIPTVGVDTQAAIPSNPLNFDQEALKEEKENAERDAKGDLIHTVKSKSETLQSIAQWYTSSSANAKEVADKNALPLDAKLNPGAKVIIPSKIVVNPKRMK